MIVEQMRMTRLWDTYLSDRDKLHVSRFPKRSSGAGEQLALLLVDNYRNVLGDKPMPLLEAVSDWPDSTGVEGWRAVEKIAKVLEAAREAGAPIVHVTGLEAEVSGIASVRVHRANTTVESTLMTEAERRRRFEIHPTLAPIPGEALIKKTAPSAFFGTPLMAHLHALQVDTLIVTGESTSGCVRATVVDAASYRFRVLVPEDCVYDRHEASHAINLFDMDRKYADVVDSAYVIDAIGAVEGAR